MSERVTELQRQQALARFLTDPWPDRPCWPTTRTRSRGPAAN